MSAKKPPFDPDKLYQRALSLHHMGKLPEAESIYKTLLGFFPNQTELLSTLGTLYLQQGRHDEGFKQLNKSLRINQEQPAVLYNMGVELQKLARLEEALACYDQALGLNPRDINSLINRGNTLKDLRKYKEAIASFEHALSINPTASSAHWNKALTHILIGEYEQGWQEYEWGWQSGGRGDPRAFTQPTWLGNESINGKTIFIYREQGLGDLIQFSRYIPMIEKLGANVMLEAPASLVSLMDSLSDSITVIEEGQPLPAYDVVCPIMSLPVALKTTLATIPFNDSYLKVSNDKKQYWQKKLGEKTTPRIGIVWSGSTTNKIDLNVCSRRNIPLDQLNPLFELPLEFHVLQTEFRAEDTVTLANLNKLHLHRDDLKDFSDTAALIQEMYLIISVCTSVAHLAGALGQATLVLLPYSADYRWLAEGNTSPWYPSIELIRQDEIENWANVIRQTMHQLKTNFSLK